MSKSVFKKVVFVLKNDFFALSKTEDDS